MNIEITDKMIEAGAKALAVQDNFTDVNGDFEGLPLWMTYSNEARIAIAAAVSLIADQIQRQALTEVARLKRQRDDLQAANNAYLERARKAEAECNDAYQRGVAAGCNAAATFHDMSANALEADQKERGNKAIPSEWIIHHRSDANHIRSLISPKHGAQKAEDVLSYLCGLHIRDGQIMP